MELLKYKDFEGSAELDMERKLCRGRLLFIDDVVTYESSTIDGLQGEFEAAVDDYLSTCEQVGKEPQKPCRGQFNVRVPPALHRAAAREAVIEKTTLNDIVRKSLEVYLRREPASPLETSRARKGAAGEVATGSSASNVTVEGFLLESVFGGAKYVATTTSATIDITDAGAPEPHVH